MIMLLLLNSFVCACFVTVFLLVWLRSDAVVEYARLFGFKTFWREFKDARIQAAPELLSFPRFLKQKWDCWFTRLLVCPLCLSLMCSIIGMVGVALFYSNLFILISIPVVCVFSLVMYGVITKLINLTP